MGIGDKSRTAWIAAQVLPHERALRGWLGRRGTSTLDPDDIVQECYAVFAQLDSVDHIRSPRNYLFEIASSLILREVRRSRVVSIEAMANLEQLGLAAQDPLPDAYVAARRELGDVMEAITLLPHQAREVFVLRRLRGLSQREVADELGLAESTVEKHLSRAVRTLMARFGRGGSTGSGASMPEEVPGKLHAGSEKQRRN